MAFEEFPEYGSLANAIVSALRAQGSESAPAWIPVSERLPETGVDVVMRLDNPIGGHAYRTGMIVGSKARHWHIPRHDAEIGDEPTHWMPLPNPPFER